MDEKQIREGAKSSVDLLVDMASKGELIKEVESVEEPKPGTLLPGDTIADKLRAYEEFLDNSPRSFRRKFVKETFSERIKKAAAKKI